MEFVDQKFKPSYEWAAAKDRLSGGSRMHRFGISFPFFAAPMVGISHVAFRELVRSYTPPEVQPLLFTEMLSTRRLPSEKLAESRELAVIEGERHFVPQLLGNEERFIRPSVEKLATLQPWGVDINMGCPASHILRHNWGVRLLGDATYAAEVVAITKKWSTVPVSVKIRCEGPLPNSGDIAKRLDLEAFTKTLEHAGVDWMTIHARSAEQGHEGKADWPKVGDLRSRCAIPIVVNGDIQTADDAISVIKQYDLDGAMIGRAVTARPWIFWQIAWSLGLCAQTPEPPLTAESEGLEYFVAAKRFAKMLHHRFGDTEYALKKFQFWAAISGRWFLFGHAFWKRTMRVKSIEQVTELVDDYSNSTQHLMNQRVAF